MSKKNILVDHNIRLSFKDLVIIISVLIIVSVILIPIISNIVKNNKLEDNNKRIEVLIKAGEEYYNNNKKYYTDGFCRNVTGIGLSKEELIDAYGDEFNGVIKYQNGEFKYIEDGTC